MKFENQFTVKAPVDEVWNTLMDVELVAPAMPGAEVLERTGEDAYKVGVKVKLGPMSMLYRGQVEITERDDAARHAVMRARATEARGQGTANAEVQMSLAEEPDGTKATIDTDLALSGRAAAMGAGVITDVAGALVDEFAANLEQMLSSGAGGGAADPPSEPGPSPEASGPVRGETVPPPADGVSAPPRTPPRAAAAPSSSVPVGRIAASVISRRLADPRTLVITTVGFAVVCIALGYAIGRAT